MTHPRATRVEMRMPIRLILSLALLSAPVLAAKPPNIVWIVADDMSPDTAAYGMTGVSTPHLDRLAAEGARFTRAYASAPVCSSSRSAFILGVMQTTTGLHAHDVENPQPLPAPWRHLPGLLRDAGWHVTNAPAPGTERGGRAVKKAKTHYNFAHDPAGMYDGDDWRKRRPGQPFFAQFQIVEPHRPFPIPEEYDDALMARMSIPPNYPDHPLVRRDWYAYLRSVEVVDKRVGDILRQLAGEGVLDDTLVIFFADHGRPMPWGKQWLTIEGLRVPLLMRGPGVEAGRVEERLASLIDLAPTALQLAGLPLPEWMQGRPLLGAPFPERERIFAARDRCGDAQDRIRAVITADHLFARHFHPGLSFMNWSGYKEASYPAMPLLRELAAAGSLTEMQARYLKPDRPPLELHDLKSDPLGVTGAALSGDNARVLARLSGDLDQWIKDSGDRGGLPDPATEPGMEEIRKSKRQDYQRTWERRGLGPEPSDAERVSWWLRQYGLAEPSPPPR
ncbi:MAG TPA: arylsulfatase [Verrucomicrobiales bacterium]|nr:arylsulfatase [Verrucomicrobiales bacterium]